MSRGKYSPFCYTKRYQGNVDDAFRFNCYGEVPPVVETLYDPIIHFGNYDVDGFDSYGYSAFDIDGKYMGIGDGIDRYGYTESEYMYMDDETFLTLSFQEIASFKRIR